MTHINDDEFDLEIYFQKANKEYGWDFDDNQTVEDGEYSGLESGDEGWERRLAKKLMDIYESDYDKWKKQANKAYKSSQPF